MASLIILKIPPAPATDAPVAQGAEGLAQTADQTAADTGVAIRGSTSDAIASGAGTSGGAAAGGSSGSGIAGVVAGLARAGPAALLISLGIGTAKAAFAKWNATAMEDGGWARAAAAAQRLADSFTLGALSSQVVQRGLDVVARQLADTVRAVDRTLSDPATFAGAEGALRRARDVLGWVHERFEAVAEIMIGRFNLSLLELSTSIARTAEIKARSQGLGSYASGPEGFGQPTAAFGGIGAGESFVEPQNRMFGDRGTAQPEGMRWAPFVESLEDLAREKSAIQARIDAAKGRLEGYLGLPAGALGGPVVDRRGSGPAPDDLADNAAPRTPAEAARAATESAFDQLAAWSRSVSAGPGRQVADALRSALQTTQERLSQSFARARDVVASLAGTYRSVEPDFATLLDATSALAAGFAAVAQQAEQIASSNSRVARLLASAELLAMGTFAAIEAGIETAAGIAAAAALDVASAVLHFTSAAFYATAAAIALGRGTGAIRSPGEARALAQSRADAIGGRIGGGGGARRGSLVLNIVGDVDFERDEPWLRRNVLRPIVSAGAAPPEDGGYGLTPVARARVEVNVLRALAGAVPQLDWTSPTGRNTNIGALVGLLGVLLGPAGFLAPAVGAAIGRYLGRDITGAIGRGQREVRRFGRRLRRIF